MLTEIKESKNESWIEGIILISNNALNSLISHLIIKGITKKTDKNIERRTTQDTHELQFILSIGLHCSTFH